MNKSIYDPAIPYVGAIEAKFTPGRIIKIRGTVPAAAYRFNINLQCGPQTAPQDDIALQVTIQILDGYITFNSLQNGMWGEEHSHLKLSIKRAETFEIILQCDFNMYKVSINNQHHYEFPQRIHFDHISHLAIDGDVSIIEVSYKSESQSTGVPAYSVAVTNSYNNSPLVPSASSMPLPGFVLPQHIYNGTQDLNSIPKMPYPTSYPQGGPPNNTCLPPADGTIPLNVASSNFRPVKPNNTRKYCISGLTVVLILVMVILVVILKRNKQSKK